MLIIFRITALSISIIFRGVCDNSSVDSLGSVTGDHKLYLAKAEVLQTKDTDSTLYYLGLCEQACLGDEKKNGPDIFFRMASVYSHMGFYDHSNRLFGIAAERAAETENTDMLIKSRNWLGYSYSQTGDTENAIGTLLGNLQFCEENNVYEKLPETYMMLGFTFRDMGKEEEGLKYFLLAQESAAQHGINENISTIINEIGNLYSTMGDTGKGLEYQKKALELRMEQRDTTLIGYSYNDIANTYLLKKDYTRALKYFNRSLEIHKALNNQWGAFYSLINISLAYNGLNQYIKQKQVLDEAFEIAAILRLNTLYLEYYKNVYLFYESLGDYKKVYENYNRYILYRDSVNREHTLRQIALINSSYDAEKKDREIARRESENQRLKLIMIITFLALFSSIVVTVLLVRSFFIRRKINLLLERKNQEIMRVNSELMRKSEELLERNAEIQNQRDEYLKLNATKDKFFSIIAHDLKNPLAGLTGMTDILVTSGSSLSEEERVEIYGILNDSVKVTNSLLENLLLWSRSQTGGLQMKKEVIRVQEMCREIVNLSSNHARTKDIALIDRSDGWMRIYADYNMMHTVLRNLVDNAIKFTENGGTVIIETRESGDFAGIHVTDTGAGISEKDIEMLFRIDVNTLMIGKSKEKGSGLGLIICREFVEMNGGRIWVESKENEGSRFIFTVPLYREE